MPGKLGWGILGTGGIAHTLAKAITQSQSSCLVAVGSRTQAAADAFGNEFQIPHRYGGYDGVLANPDVQAVYISLPNHLHAEWAIACARAGKAILLEKPFALNIGEAMAVVEAARHHGVFLLEAFMYRCHPQTAKLVDLLKSGAIGDVRVIQANFAYNMGQNLGNIRLQNAAGGGALMDVGCYCLSMARLIAGAAQGRDAIEPVDLRAVAHVGDASRVDEWTTAVVRFPGDILATLTCGNQVNMGAPLTIWGSAGSITVTNPWFPGDRTAPPVIELRRDGQDVDVIHTPSDVPLYTHEVDTVARHLAHQQAPAPCMTWADSLANQKWLDQWRRQVKLTFDRESPEQVATTIFAHPTGIGPRAPMPMGRIGGIDKPVSRIVLGTMWHVVGDFPKTCAMLDQYVQIGGNAFDCALVYGSQDRVGRWVALRGNREQIVIVGKGAADSRATPDMVDSHLRLSLQQAGLDYFDAFLMHRDNPGVPVAEFVDVLESHRVAGRIRAYGGSNWTPARLAEANAYAARTGKQGFTASSPNFALAHWNEPMWGGCVNAVDPDSITFHRKTGMALLAWSAQANGFFTGRFSRADKGRPELADIERVWFNDGNFRRLDRVHELAALKHVPPALISMAYVLCQPINIFALIGPENIDEMRANIAALDVTLTPAELAWLNLEA
ncbi:MAG: aldo/keto reductase [Lentisphaerae bacterium]|nr:aldo/keto reductase [Lentisphaerota bacterium]